MENVILTFESYLLKKSGCFRENMKIIKHLKRFLKRHYYRWKYNKYNNIVDAMFMSEFVRKNAGGAVLVVESESKYRVTTKVSYIGFVCFLFWYGIFTYCACKTFAEDQTILRKLYSTKLKHYGDYFERTTAILHFVYAMWKVPFNISGCSHYMQDIINIDVAIRKLGESVDISEHGTILCIIAIVQVGVSITRWGSIWGTFNTLNINIPTDLLFLVVYNDSLSFIITALYCGYLILLKKRLEIINGVLNKINLGSSWEYSLMARSKSVDTVKAFEFQEKQVSEKLRCCAIIYSMLFKGADKVGKMFGLALAINFILSLACVVLNCFYFMEATASGMYKDLKRYIYFCMYIVWQNAYGVGKIFLTVHYSELYVNEAKRTALVTHEIINKNLSPRITEEAMQLSMQLLHQSPKFTANGLYNLDYTLLLSAYRSLMTFLALLLQFATDTY